MFVTLEARGALLRVEDRSGAPDEWPALLFLHYRGGSATTWRKVVGDLEGEVRCVALDQRGWGSSTVADGR